MENVKICEIRNGINSNYPHLISPDEKYLFCCLHKLGNYKANDKVYCIDRSRNKAFFTAISGEEIQATYNSKDGNWEFKYDHHSFYSRKDDVFLKLNVFDKQPIPADWGWSKALGQNQIYDLWKPGIGRPEERLVKVNDLQRLFKEGPAADTLENCRRSLGFLSKALVVNVVPEESFTSDAKVTLYEPLNEHSKEDSTDRTNIIDFNDEHRQLIIAAKTEPFIILAGISGIGKSRLARTIAYRTCFEKELQHIDQPGNFEMIRVKADWHDNSEIIGHPIADSSKFFITAFIKFLVKAWKYVHVPFFLCLDEMNLANIDSYFSDYLGILETRRYHDGQMYTDAFIKKDDLQHYYSQDASFWSQLGLTNESELYNRFLTLGITLPPNLTVIGTVNMNETTHALSSKVLDRAMIIEMNKVDIRKGLEVQSDDWQYPQHYIPAGLLNDRLQDVSVAYHRNRETSIKVLDELEEIHDYLYDTPFRPGYRIRNQMMMYCACNGDLKRPETWLNTCIDEAIMMKILTRIEGSENKCSSIINTLLEKTNEKFPESHRKLERMQRQLEISGYTSFWF